MDQTRGLELIPLCRAVMKVRDIVTLPNTPSGTLMIGELFDSVWEGERFRLVQRGRAAADWLVKRPDGTAQPDIRLTMESENGDLVYIEYTGRFDFEAGIGYTCPRFTTGAPALQWLNRIQAVGKAYFDAETLTVTYPQFYELR